MRTGFCNRPTTMCACVIYMAFILKSCAAGPKIYSVSVSAWGRLLLVSHIISRRTTGSNPLSLMLKWKASTSALPERGEFKANAKRSLVGGLSCIPLAASTCCASA